MHFGSSRDRGQVRVCGSQLCLVRRPGGRWCGGRETRRSLPPRSPVAVRWRHALVLALRHYSCSARSLWQRRRRTRTSFRARRAAPRRAALAIRLCIPPSTPIRLCIPPSPRRAAGGGSLAGWTNRTRRSQGCARTPRRQRGVRHVVRARYAYAFPAWATIRRMQTAMRHVAPCRYNSLTEWRAFADVVRGAHGHVAVPYGAPHSTYSHRVCVE